MFKNLLTAFFLLFVSFLPSSVLAISLGDSEVLSYLGEAVRVEIEILQWEEETYSQLEVTLASEANFTAFGLNYSPVLTELVLSIPEPTNQKLLIQLTSNDDMQEPFMEVLLLLRWPGGSLLREYIFFFDPPPPPPPVRVISPATNTTRAPVVVRTPVPVTETVLIVKPEPTSELTPEPIPEPLPEPVQPEAVSLDVIIDRREYLVQPGDSLWNIALQFQSVQSDYNFFQMLLGIFELNPAAFQDGNISMLNVNQTIVIPGTNDLNNIDPDTAEDIYNQHWEESIGVFDSQGEEAPIASIIAPANEEPVEEKRYIPEGNTSLVKSDTPDESSQPSSLNEESLPEDSELIPFEPVSEFEALSESVDEPGAITPALEASINSVTSSGTRASESLEPVLASEQNSVASEGKESNVSPETRSNSAPIFEEEQKSTPQATVQSQNTTMKTLENITQRREQQLQDLETKVEQVQKTAQSRGQHIEQLEAQVENVRQQLSEVRTITASLAKSLEAIREKREAREKTMDRIIYLLFAIAFSLTAGLVYYVIRGPQSPPQPKRRRRVH